MHEFIYRQFSFKGYGGGGVSNLSISVLSLGRSSAKCYHSTAWRIPKNNKIYDNNY